MKIKGLVIALVSAFIVVCGVLGVTIYMEESSKPSFTEDGYILAYDESGNTENQIVRRFNAGTKYSFKYPDKVTFTDADGVKVVTDANAFVHYNSGAVESLKDSVMINLEEVGADAINYYGLNSASVVQKTGSNYSIESSGGDVGLEKALWKMGENRYLLLADDISVAFSDGTTQSFSEYVELYYYESGMVAFINDEGEWRTASANCHITINGGITINATNRTVLVDDAVKMSMTQMVANSDDNINILPSGYSEDEIRVPEFDVTVIDGINGEQGKKGTKGIDGEQGELGKRGEIGDKGDKGEEGVQGEIGTPGAPGNTGTTGTTGVKGSDGLEGITGEDGIEGDAGAEGSRGRAGAAGAAGGAGANGASGAAGAAGAAGVKGIDGIDVEQKIIDGNTTILKDLPRVEMETLTVKSDSIEGSLIITNEGCFPTDEGIHIVLTDTTTGEIIKDETIMATAVDLSFVFDELKQNYSYDIDIISKYKVSPADTEVYEGVFYHKQVYTDVAGLIITLRDATTDSISFDIDRTHSEILTVNYKLEMINENRVAESIIEDDVDLSSEGRASITLRELNKTTGTLLPNHTYYFSITKMGNSEDVPEQYKNITVQTLKRMPVISDAMVVVNKKANIFELSLNQVYDPDNSIEGYRYEIYDNAIDSDIPVKTVYSTSTRGIYCNVVDFQNRTALDDNTTLYNDKNYTMKVVAEVYDNYKNVDVSTYYNQVFTMDKFNSRPYIVVKTGLSDDDRYPNKIECSLEIHFPSGSELNEAKPITLRYFDEQNEELNKILNAVDVNTSKSIVTETGETVYYFKYIADDLKQNTDYRFAAYGTIGYGNGIYYDNAWIDTIFLKTGIYSEISGRLQPPAADENTNSAIAAKLILEVPAGASIGKNDSAYALSQVKKVRVSMYDGVADGNNYDELEVVESFEVDVVKEGNIYTAKELITEDSMTTKGIEAFSSAKYSIKIEYAMDGTKYTNQIGVNQSLVCTGEIRQTYPGIDDIDLIVTPITIGNIDSYKEGFNTAGYNADTILGYAVRATGFDHGLSLFKYIEYDVFDDRHYQSELSGDLENPDNFYAKGKPILKIQLPTSNSNSISAPSAVFLFDETGAGNCAELVKNRNKKNVSVENAEDTNVIISPEDKRMTRGRHYRFTVRAMLADGSGYYPEAISSADMKRVLLKDVIYKAPYQAPSPYFYPKTSDSNSSTWGYYIKAKDEEAISTCNKNFTVSYGSKKETYLISQNAQDSVLKISGLSDKIEVKINLDYSDCYYPEYSDRKTTLNLPEFYFRTQKTWSTASTELKNVDNPSGLAYKIVQQDEYNRFKVVATLKTEDLANKVTALSVKITDKNNTSHTKELPVKVTVTGNELVSYLNYVSVSEFKGETMLMTVSVYYDTEVAGFYPPDDDTSPIYALQIMNSSIEGKYAVMKSTNDGMTINSSEKAQDSIYSIYSFSKSSYNLITLDTENPLFKSRLAHYISIYGKGTMSDKIGEAYFMPKKLGKLTLSGSVEATLPEFTPTVDLNEGAQITISTISDQAEVTWSIHGWESAHIIDKKVYFSLHTVEPDNSKPPVKDDGGNEIIIENILTSGKDDYKTIISNLEPETTYAIQIYYYDSTDVPAKKVYPINEYNPELAGEFQYYQFTTETPIKISNTSVKYTAVSYTNKSIDVSYSLSSNKGFNIAYALYYKAEGDTHYTIIKKHNEIAPLIRGGIPSVLSTEMKAEIDYAPGVLEDKSGKPIPVSELKNYYFRIIPLSYTSGNPPAASTQEEYDQWLTNNNLAEGGTDTYVNLKVSNLSTPFYTIKAIPLKGNQVKFNIAISDTDGVINDSMYKIRVIDNADGTDITPDTKMGEMPSRAADYVTANVSDASKGVTLKLYTTYDLENTGLIPNISTIASDVMVGNPELYLKKEVKGTSIVGKDYSLGTLQQIVGEVNQVRLDFVDSVGLEGNIISLTGTVTKQNSATTRINIDDPAVVPVDDDSSRVTIRFGPQYEIAAPGAYTYNLRLVVRHNNGDEVLYETEELTLLYYKSN